MNFKFGNIIRVGLTLWVLYYSQTISAQPVASEASRNLAAYERACQSSGSTNFFLDSQSWSSTAPQRSLQDLRNFVRDQRISSPRGLVSAFRQAAQNSWPQNSVLLSHSNSAQSDYVDSNNPRILMYGNGLILGATGHSNPSRSPEISQGNNQVEVIQFDSNENRYRFGLLDFNSTPPRLQEPTSCFRCHGNPPRPIWQPLQFWDHLTRVNQGTPFQRPNSIYSDLGNTSMDNWRNLLNFTGYLDHLSLRYTAATLTASPNYSQYRYATLAAVLGCEDIPSFVGRRAESMNRISRGIPHLITNTQEIISQNNDLARNFGRSGFQQVRNRILDSSLETRDVDAIAALRFLYEGREISLRHLSSRRARGENRYGYGFLSSGNVSELGAQELACYLLPEAIRSDPRLSRLLSRQSQNGSLGASATIEECQFLKTLSLEALRDTKNSETRSPIQEKTH